MVANPYQQYQATQIQTAGTGDLVLLLYDGAIRFLNRALIALDEGRIPAASADIIRGQEIVLELMAGLDFERGGDLAGNLRNLYEFCYHTLVQASLRKDAERIRTVTRLLSRVRDAWRAVVRGDAAGAVPAGRMAA